MSTNVFKRSLLFFLIITVCLVFTACGSTKTENRANIIEEYYENLKYGKYEEAYEMLAQKSKDNISFEDYEEYHINLRDLVTLEEYKIDIDNNEIKDYTDSDGNVYNGSIYVPIDTRIRLSAGKNKGEIIPSSMTYILIKEGEHYGILWRGDNILAENLSDLYRNLAMFKLDEEHPDLEHVLQLTEKALKNDDTNTSVYSLQYDVYRRMNRLNDALNSINNYIAGLKATYSTQVKDLTEEQEAAREKIHKELYSNALVKKALVMETPQQAKVYLQEAISIDPENQWAMDVLAEIGKFMK